MTRPDTTNGCRPEDLPLYHYGELDAATGRRLEDHLQTCAACREELAQLQALLRALPRAQPEISPARIRDFNERLQQRLRPRRSRPLRPAWGWALATATAVLLLVILFPPRDGLPPAERQPGGRVATMEQLPDADLLLNMELLQNLDVLQQLEGPEGNG